MADERMTNHEHTLLMVRVVLFNLVGFAALTVSGWISLVDKSDGSAARGGIAFLAAAMCFFFGNLDRLESFKAGLTGVEGKTRDIVAKAEVTMRQLQKLALQFGALLIEQNAAAGRWDSQGSKADERKADVLAALAEIGVPEAEIFETSVVDRKYVLADYFHAMRLVLQPLTQGDTRSEAIRIVDNILSRRMECPAPLVEDFASAMRSKLLRPSAILDRWLASYEIYRVTGRHGDPEIWARRDVCHQMALDEVNEGRSAAVAPLGDGRIQDTATE